MTKLQPLCDLCSREMDRWLDTRPSTLFPRLSVAYGSGAAYDASMTGVRDNQAARHAQWVTTVRQQRTLIMVGCRAGRHAQARVDT